MHSTSQFEMVSFPPELTAPNQTDDFIPALVPVEGTQARLRGQQRQLQHQPTDRAGSESVKAGSPFAFNGILWCRICNCTVTLGVIMLFDTFAQIG